MSRVLTQQQFLDRANKIHQGRYLYDKAIYVNGQTKIEVNCSDHGLFLVTPENHLYNRSGCPTCYHDRAKIGKISGSYWNRVVRSAEKRAIPLLLTQTEAWELFTKQNGKCSYTGWSLDFTTNGANQTASLDRRDSSGPYSKENCHWVHKHVNLAKYTLGENEFINLCHAIRNNLTKPSLPQSQPEHALGYQR